VRFRVRFKAGAPNCRAAPATFFQGSSPPAKIEKHTIEEIRKGKETGATMASVAPESLGGIEKRIEALEVALAVPGEATATTKSADAEARIAQLERALTRTQYRLAHLEKAYDRLVLEKAA